MLPELAERADGRRARRRAVGEDRPASSRPARWPSGLAAAVALDPSPDARRNAAAMEETLRHVRTGGVTEAARDDTQGRFRRGDSVGFIDEELVAWGEPQRDARGRARRAGPRGRAADRDRGRRRAAGAATPWRRWRPTAPRSSCRAAGSRRGGGSCPPSSRPQSSGVPRRGPHRLRHQRSAARTTGRAALPAALAAGRAAQAAGREGGEGGRAARPEHRRGPARARPARPPRRAHDRRAGDRRDRHRRRRGAHDQEPARAPARDEAARRGARGRRDRHDGRDVLQPAVAGAPLPAGHAAAADRQVPGPARLPRQRARRDRRARGRPARTWPPTRRRTG